ncbi:hypothetical protein M8C21_005368 [Ambrosia artemisiifolia]|uniref:Kinesin-like protein n=1 Tax=Ambrosia artemisiifolia TaxID=4212 RepID=A0AAD5GGG8_AMBAR|nr:hypothetical protein M8C21_005368 [Ambrosia artemisiifolia]
MADKIQEFESPTMNINLFIRHPDQTLQQSHTESEQQILPVFEKLSKTVASLRKEQIELCNEFKSMTADSFLGSEVLYALQTLGEEHETLKKKYQEECQMLKNRCQLECSERRRLYNEVIELKGNIRVFCRCRPMNHDEIAKGSTSVADFDSAQENELRIIGPDSSRKQFKFDHIFRPEDNQEAVFAQTSPLVVSVLDGFNVCIFAYGQTGTGKTFTMEGSAENRGVNYRTLEELFSVSNERSDIMKYQLFVSMLEVYNEKIKDLLVEDAEHPAKKLEIKQSAEGTQEVPGLSQVPVNKTDEVWELLKSGSRVRSVGSTNANELSSRSHCLLRVTVLGENLVNGQRTRSHLWLVDLAGSERVGKIEVEGERLKESQFINKSLSALGDVISALASKTAHIPYRNSKLTHILQSSLGGDCKTLMFVQISPSSADLGETICSLNFASRVRGIEHGPARKQTDITELFKYKQLVRELENQLAEERKTRQKQENRALAVASSHPLLSSLTRSLSTISEKRPPLGPSSKMRLPLRIVSNFIPSPAATQKPRHFTASRFSNEDKENRSNFKPLSRARQGSPAIKPAPATTFTSQIKPKRRASAATFHSEPSSRSIRPAPTTTFTSQIKPRRRASVTTFHSEPSFSSSMMTTPISRYSAAPQMRSDRVVGRQSFMWDPQRVRRMSLLGPSSTPRPMTVEATPVAAPRSSRFMGSPHSHIVGSWKPKHPTVVALQRRQLVWSPLKYRGSKGDRKPFV